MDCIASSLLNDLGIELLCCFATDGTHCWHCDILRTACVLLDLADDSPLPSTSPAHNHSHLAESRV